MKIKNIKY